MSAPDLAAIEARAALCVTEAVAHATGQAWTSSYMASAADVQALVARVRELEADVALQGDALMRWREMTGDETPHAARARAEAAEAEVARLRAALENAHEGLLDMRPYVGDYHAEKWGHDAYIERAQAALDGSKAAP